MVDCLRHYVPCQPPNANWTEQGLSTYCTTFSALTCIIIRQKSDRIVKTFFRPLSCIVSSLLLSPINSPFTIPHSTHPPSRALSLLQETGIVYRDPSSILATINIVLLLPWYFLCWLTSFEIKYYRVEGAKIETLTGRVEVRLYIWIIIQLKRIIYVNCF